MKPNKTKFVPTVCECCEQTKDYALALDKGTAMIVLAIYNAVRRKGENRVHIVQEMLVPNGAYSSYRAMAEDGRMTHHMVNNVMRAKYHGLVAQVDGGGLGEYLITPKGARFLRNEPVPRTAIINKVKHSKDRYLDDEMVTFSTLVKAKEAGFWNVEPSFLDKIAAYNADQATLL